MPERFSEFAKLDENQRYVNNHLEKKIKKLKESLIKYNIDEKNLKFLNSLNLYLFSSYIPGSLMSDVPTESSSSAI